VLAVTQVNPVHQSFLLLGTPEDAENLDPDK